MLKFYLTTVIIYMIIIYSVITIFRDSLRKRLGSNEDKKTNLFKTLGGLFVLAAVPILRLVIVGVLIFAATCKQEDFDKLVNKS